MNRQNLPTALISTLISCGFVLLAWPVWRWLWGEWWSNAYYSHGLLVVAVACYLGIRRLATRLPGTTFSGDTWGVPAVALSLGAYLFSLANHAYYVAAFAAICLLTGLIWSLGGLGTIRLLAFPLAYLALAIPLPFLERTTLPLALWTGACSGSLVQWLGLDAAIAGAAVTLPNANLVIGAQCSGINSLMALTALLTLLAYIVRGPLWGRLILVVAAVPLALLGNILRVANLLYVARYLGADAAFRFYHDYSGLLFFALILLLLLPITKLLRCNALRYELFS